MKKINRYINHDLKLIVHLMSLNSHLVLTKLKKIIFRPKGKDVTNKTQFLDKWPTNIYLKTKEVSRYYVI